MKAFVYYQPSGAIQQVSYQADSDELPIAVNGCAVLVLDAQGLAIDAKKQHVDVATGTVVATP